jgi:hypothetical protein
MQKRKEPPPGGSSFSGEHKKTVDIVTRWFMLTASLQ